MISRLEKRRKRRWVQAWSWWANWWRWWSWWQSAMRPSNSMWWRAGTAAPCRGWRSISSSPAWSVGPFRSTWRRRDYTVFSVRSDWASVHTRFGSCHWKYWKNRWSWMQLTGAAWFTAMSATCPAAHQYDTLGPIEGKNHVWRSFAKDNEKWHRCQGSNGITGSAFVRIAIKAEDYLKSLKWNEFICCYICCHCFRLSSQAHSRLLAHMRCPSFGTRIKCVLIFLKK